MDLSDRIGVIQQSAAQVRDLMRHERVVVCLGQRATLCFFLAGHLSEQQLVGACTTASEALLCIASRAPTFLLCSDQLEAGCGIELVITAKARWPALRTLLLVCGRPPLQRLRAAVEANCDGMLLDASFGRGSATSALVAVCRGGIVIDRTIVELLRRGQEQPISGAMARLSPREREVLGLLARGHNNSEIAQELVISLDTVKTHVKNLLLKLGAKGRTHAAVLAIEQGLVDWPKTAGAR